MRSRQLLTWAVILAVAAGAWLLSAHLDQRHQEEEALASRLMPPEGVMAARSLDLAGREYPQPVRLESGGQEGWRLTQPLQWPADGLVVGRMLTSLAQARVSQRLAQPGPLADFGLDPPSLELTLAGPSGPASRLLVGELSPSGESVYLARPGQPGVLLAPAELRGALLRGLLELRDKTVLDFPLDQVRQLELRQEGAPALLLERQEAGGWQLAGQGAADPREVENLLLQTHGLLAQGFVDQGFKPAKLGLEPPRNLLMLTMQDGGQRGLVWGTQVPGKNQVYTRRQEGGPLLLVSDEGLARLRRQPRDLLDRRVFTLDRAAVEGLKIARQGSQMVFARQDAQWRRIEPPGGPQEAQLGERLLWDLLDLKWEQIMPPGQYGLESPALSLSIWPQEGPGAGQTLDLGRADPQGGLVAARVRGRAEILGVQLNFLDKIPQEAGEPAPAPGEQGHSVRK